MTVPQGKAQPAAGSAVKPRGDEVQVVSDASALLCTGWKCLDCETLWMLATGTAIGPYLFCNMADVARFKNLVLVHAARFAADLQVTRR